MALSTVGVSKCGEVFVTNNADKWIFICSYCQKTIDDIGVFVCHIRLDHLGSVEDFKAFENDTVKPEVQTIYSDPSEFEAVEATQCDNICPAVAEDVRGKHFVKDEETLSQFSFNSQTFTSKIPKEKYNDSDDCTEVKNNVSNKNAFEAYISSDESNEEFLPTDNASQQEEFMPIEGNNETIQLDFESNEEIIDIDDEEDVEEILDSDESNKNNEGENTEIENSLKYKCRFCLRRFASARGLHYHKIRKHGEKCLTKLHFKCKICDKAFQTERSLKQHLLAHDKNNSMQCQVCSVNLYNLRNLLQHVMKHESDKCFPCQSCGKVFYSNEERVTHWKAHAKDKPFACSTCFRRFSKEYILERHLSQHGKYSCHFCSKYFITTDHLRFPYTCVDCAKLPDVTQVAERLRISSNKKPSSFSNGSPSMEMTEEYFTIMPAVKQKDFHPSEKNEIVRVLYSRNDEFESITNETNYETIEDATEQDTNSIYSLDDEYSANEDTSTNFENNDDNRASCSKRKREEDQKQDLRHTCEFCNMSFKFRSELDYHLKKTHNLKMNEMPLKCRECKKKFRSVAGFKNHSKSHDEKNNIQCPICQVKHTQSYFVAHVLSHESATCFPCQVCGKIFNNNEERVEHWKTHAYEMPFKCDFCYRRFRKQQYLTHHMKSHFQYQCQFCPTQFNAVETQKPPYACTTCENLPDIRRRLENQRSIKSNQFQK